jgi:hypothetical protein
VARFFIDAISSDDIDRLTGAAAITERVDVPVPATIEQV